MEYGERDIEDGLAEDDGSCSRYCNNAAVERVTKQDLLHSYAVDKADSCAV